MAPKVESGSLVPRAFLRGGFRRIVSTPTVSPSGFNSGGRPDDSMPRRIGADAWFDRRDAERFEVHEQTMRTSPEETLTLVAISDPKMLEDQEYRGRK
jgi:hypothetical protein